MVFCCNMCRDRGQGGDGGNLGDSEDAEWEDSSAGPRGSDASEGPGEDEGERDVLPESGGAEDDDGGGDEVRERGTPEDHAKFVSMLKR
jgi:hypothetical protein